MIEDSYKLNYPLWLIKETYDGFSLYHAIKARDKSTFIAKETHRVSLGNKEVYSNKNERSINSLQDDLVKLISTEGQRTARKSLEVIFEEDIR